MPKTKKISPEKAVEMIYDAGSQFFTVTFVKRTDNTLRTMNCRRGVKAGVKGTGKKSKPKGLVTVYDMKNRAYRRINLSGIRQLRMHGTEYKVG
jgi:hypothetical protein